MSTTPVDDSTTPTGPEPSSSGTSGKVPPARKFPLRIVLVALGAAVVAWYLFILDTAANNNVLEGLGKLVRGVRDLPGILIDGEAYSNWWTFVTDREGLDNVFATMVEHVQLVAMSMLFATIISVIFGVLVHRVTALRGPVLGVAAIFLTIPSLALFAVFISVPGVGIGDRGPIIALTLYSILPILRNTVIGLEDVDRAVIESAKGMGLNATQRLLRIELPLAWPIILTGIRVAALLNIGIAAIAPLVGGTGLGGYIRDGLQRFPQNPAVELMWTGVVATIVLALIADLAFNLIRRFTTSKGLR